MIALDGGTSADGINPLAKSTLINSVIGQLFPEIANIDTDLVVSRNFIPNVEEIVRARPDVVIQWDFKLDTASRRWKTPGIKVSTVGYGESRDAARLHRHARPLLGKEERAQSFLDWDDQTVAELDARSRTCRPASGRGSSSSTA